MGKVIIAHTLSWKETCEINCWNTTIRDTNRKRTGHLYRSQATPTNCENLFFVFPKFLRIGEEANSYIYRTESASSSCTCFCSKICSRQKHKRQTKVSLQKTFCHLIMTCGLSFQTKIVCDLFCLFRNIQKSISRIRGVFNLERQKRWVWRKVSLSLLWKNFNYQMASTS